MNTNQELDRIVRDWLADRAVEPTRSSLHAALERVEDAPQQRHRWLGRWLGRGGGATRSAGYRGGPSGTGRSRLMYSITTVAASLAALALAATLVVPRGDPGAGVVPGAPAGATHVVAADGSGDFTTIGEAVAAASDGDTVLVKPGEYVEALVIDKDITVRGDGPREDIVVTFKEGAPPESLDGALVYFPIILRGTDATLAGLSIRAPVGGGSVLIDGGAPRLEDLWMTLEPGGYLTIAMGGQSRPTVLDSRLEGVAATDDDGTSPTFERDTFTVDGLAVDGPGETTVRDSTFLQGSSVDTSGGMTARIEGNDFTGGGSGNATDTAITADTASNVVARDNTFTDFDMGVNVWAYSTATIEDNEFVDSGMAVVWGTTKGGAIDGNSIRGGFAGITVTDGSPSITGNTISDVTGRGIAVGIRAEAIVEGNTVCGCGVNLSVAEGSAAQVGENDICPDEPAE